MAAQREEDINVTQKQILQSIDFNDGLTQLLDQISQVSPGGHGPNHLRLFNTERLPKRKQQLWQSTDDPEKGWFWTESWLQNTNSKIRKHVIKVFIPEIDVAILSGNISEVKRLINNNHKCARTGISRYKSQYKIDKDHLRNSGKTKYTIETDINLKLHIPSVQLAITQDDKAVPILQALKGEAKGFFKTWHNKFSITDQNSLAETTINTGNPEVLKLICQMVNNNQLKNPEGRRHLDSVEGDISKKQWYRSCADKICEKQDAKLAEVLLEHGSSSIKKHLKNIRDVINNPLAHQTTSTTTTATYVTVRNATGADDASVRNVKSEDQEWEEFTTSRAAQFDIDALDTAQGDDPNLEEAHDDSDSEITTPLLSLN